MTGPVPVRTLAAGLLFLGAVLWAQQRDWILSREITAPVDVFRYFPLQVGNRWIYDYEYRTGDPERPTVQRWTSEVTVTEHVRLPEGLVVLRKVVAPQVPPGQFELEHYLIHGNYVYAFGEILWDRPTRSFSATFRDRLVSGDVVPDFFFPLRENLLFAEKDREDREYREWQDAKKHPEPFYHWLVEGRGGQGRAVKLSVSPQAFRLVYATIGGPTERWFEEGVGMVGEWNHHSGTYWETIIRLQKFIRAPATLKK